MTIRDLATVAFRTLAAWLFASGLAAFVSSLLTWSADVEQYGRGTAAMKLAAAAIFVPIGALGWMLSAWAAARAIRGRDEVIALSLSRMDLYAFASVLVGLFLLTEAVSQLAYWLVVWRSFRETGLSILGPQPTDASVEYWRAARAQVGAVATKGILGLALLLGPERIKAGLSRLRRDFVGEPIDREVGQEARHAGAESAAEREEEK